MRYTRWMLIATLACCAALVAVRPSAAEDKPAAKADAAHDAMMADMMKYAMPGPQHMELKKMEGSWNAAVKYWMAPGEPTVSQGSAEYKMILGDRFLEERYSGDMMGQPFEGYGLTGYDLRKGEYTMMWADNSTTQMMTGNGKYDPATKTITMASVMPGPDGKPMKSRTVTKLVDDNTTVFSLYGTEKGKDKLVMEITYTRKQ